MIEKIEPAAAIRLLDAGKATAVDVREPDEFAVARNFFIRFAVGRTLSLP